MRASGEDRDQHSRVFTLKAKNAREVVVNCPSTRFEVHEFGAAVWDERVKAM